MLNDEPGAHVSQDAFDPLHRGECVGPADLFVPFFTTKPGGSGVGLVLSRQIVEAHGGSLSLANRTDGSGGVATLVLPSAARVRVEKS